MPITDWPENERPREKLLKWGAHSLSDAELIAIFLRTGIPGKTAVDMGRDLMERYGSLTGLFQIDVAEFISQPGLGASKYVQLKAAIEIVERMMREKMALRDQMTSPQAVENYLRLHLQFKREEVFMGLFLNAQHQLLASEELFRGSLKHASIYPREVVKRALHHNAAAVIFAHNHPSGIAQASASDIKVTTVLKNALQSIEVDVLDHLIIAGTEVVSVHA